jgi:hypothetical protein
MLQAPVSWTKPRHNPTEPNHATTQESGGHPAAKTLGGGSRTPKRPAGPPRERRRTARGISPQPPTTHDRQASPDPGLTGAWGRCRRGAWTDPPAGCPRAPAPPSESRAQGTPLNPRRSGAKSGAEMGGKERADRGFETGFEIRGLL